MSDGERVYGGLDATQRHRRRREQLLDAGLERFAADGWSEATVAGICRTAGLSQRYLYEHFADREELFLAVVERISDEVEQVIRVAVATPEADAVVRARLVLEGIVDRFASDPRQVRVALVESLATERFRMRRRELLARFGDLAARLMRALRDDDRKAGSAGPAEAVTGALLTGGVVELLIAWATDAATVPPDELIDHVVALATAAARL
ncbi:MAG: TetR/AcrR family transcriptional regulator [Nitriliruptor sp.]|uniref:TetR/AcrR family transcriptional regulator n=1 Tax=Nitriliruptor sp. TaxID=2448056 RepID=UPI00349FFB5B